MLLILFAMKGVGLWREGEVAVCGHVHSFD